MLSTYLNFNVVNYGLIGMYDFNVLIINNKRVKDEGYQGRWYPNGDRTINRGGIKTFGVILSC